MGQVLPLLIIRMLGLVHAMFTNLVQIPGQLRKMFLLQLAHIQSGTFHDGNTWKYIIVSGFGETVPVAATQIYTQTLGAQPPSR